MHACILHVKRFSCHVGLRRVRDRTEEITVNALVYALKDFIRWFGKLAPTESRFVQEHKIPENCLCNGLLDKGTILTYK